MVGRFITPDLTDPNLAQAYFSLKAQPRKVLKVLLLRGTNDVFSRKTDLQKEVWGDKQPLSRVLDLYLFRIRQAFEKHNVDLELETVWGGGVRLRRRKNSPRTEESS